MNNQLNTNDSVEIHLSEKGSDLYIFFGGIAAGIAMPVFEFYKFSKILDQNKIFIRDFNQCWYQGGLPGITKDVFSTATYIKSQIENIKPDNVFFVGNSMGGFAAILFAKLVGTGQAVAFSPQTFISPFLRYQHKDYRWRKEIMTTYRRSVFRKRVWNLRPLLLSDSESNPEIRVFVSGRHHLDSIHAHHISDIRGVEVYSFDDERHNVVQVLRDSGKLPEIMSGKYTHHEC